LNRFLNDSNEPSVNVSKEQSPNASKENTLESIIPNRIMNSYTRNMLRSKSVYMVTASFDNPMYHPRQGYPDLGICKYQGIHSIPSLVDPRKFSSIENDRKAFESTRVYHSRIADSAERTKTTEMDIRSNYLPTGVTYTHFTNQATIEDQALDSLMSSGDENSAAVTPTVSKFDSEVPLSSRPYMQERVSNARYDRNEEISLSYRDRSFGSTLKGSKLSNSAQRSHVLISHLLNEQQQPSYNVKPVKVLPLKKIQLP